MAEVLPPAGTCVCVCLSRYRSLCAVKTGTPDGRFIGSPFEGVTRAWRWFFSVLQRKSAAATLAGPRSNLSRRLSEGGATSANRTNSLAYSRVHQPLLVRVGNPCDRPGHCPALRVRALGRTGSLFRRPTQHATFLQRHYFSFGRGASRRAQPPNPPRAHRGADSVDSSLSAPQVTNSACLYLPIPQEEKKNIDRNLLSAGFWYVVLSRLLVHER